MTPPQRPRPPHTAEASPETGNAAGVSTHGATSRHRRYNHSEKGRARYRRYEESPKGREVRERYNEEGRRESNLRRIFVGAKYVGMEDAYPYPREVVERHLLGLYHAFKERQQDEYSEFSAQLAEVHASRANVHTDNDALLSLLDWRPYAAALTGQSVADSRA